MTMTGNEVVDALTALDRCDRCGAQARSYVELVSGSALLFCAHHLREHRPGLEEIGARVFCKTESSDTPSPASLAM